LCKAHLFTITEHWTGCDSREARAAYHRVGDELQPDGNYDIPQEQLQSLMHSYYQNEVVVDTQEAQRIEVETQLQASCEMWRRERRKRITASNVHKIVSLKPSTKRAPRVKELLYSTFRGNCATKYGLTNENETRKAYVENMQATHPGLVTYRVGLVISTTHPWIAASPDDLVTDPSAPNPYGVAEYKTPLSAKGLTIAAACDSEQLLPEERQHNQHHQPQTYTSVLLSGSVPVILYRQGMVRFYTIHYVRLLHQAYLCRCRVMGKDPSKAGVILFQCPPSRAGLSYVL